MAETSGFFSATKESVEAGVPDRAYFARQFAQYFSLFIGNGVFGNPTNQLMVKPGNGLSVVISEGFAFIKGYWYYNDSDKVVPLVTNYGESSRVDSVRIRFSDETRDIKADVITGDTELIRGEDIYDLQLATVQVMPMSETVSAAQIQDTRPNQTVCGFVTGLMSVQTTASLFAQYQAIFDEWFENVKDQLSEDAAGSLQNQIDALTLKVDGLKNKVFIQTIMSYDSLISYEYWREKYDEDGIARVLLTQWNALVGSYIYFSERCQFAIVGAYCYAPSGKNSLFKKYFIVPLAGATKYHETLNTNTLYMQCPSVNSGKTYFRKIVFGRGSVPNEIANGLWVYPCREIDDLKSASLDEELDSSKNGSSPVVQDALRVCFIAVVSIPEGVKGITFN